jgi:hypothetical protein
MLQVTFGKASLTALEGGKAALAVRTVWRLSEVWRADLGRWSLSSLPTAHCPLPTDYYCRVGKPLFPPVRAMTQVVFVS